MFNFSTKVDVTDKEKVCRVKIFHVSVLLSAVRQEHPNFQDIRCVRCPSVTRLPFVIPAFWRYLYLFLLTCIMLCFLVLFHPLLDREWINKYTNFNMCLVLTVSIYLHSFLLIPVVVSELCPGYIFKCKTKGNNCNIRQGRVTVKYALHFHIKRSIYLQFFVDIFCSLYVISRTKFKVKKRTKGNYY